MVVIHCQKPGLAVANHLAWGKGGDHGSLRNNVILTYLKKKNIINQLLHRVVQYMALGH